MTAFSLSNDALAKVIPCSLFTAFSIVYSQAVDVISPTSKAAVSTYNLSAAFAAFAVEEGVKMERES